MRRPRSPGPLAYLEAHDDRERRKGEPRVEAREPHRVRAAFRRWRKRVL